MTLSINTRNSSMCKFHCQYLRLETEHWAAALPWKSVNFGFCYKYRRKWFLIQQKLEKRPTSKLICWDEKVCIQGKYIAAWVDNSSILYQNWCAKIEKVSIQEKLNEAGQGGFQWWGLIKKLAIPASVKLIGRCAFMSMSRFTNITLPFRMVSNAKYKYGVNSNVNISKSYI